MGGAALAGDLFDTLDEFLIDARHERHHRGPRFDEIVGQCLEGLRITYGCTGREHHIVPCHALEDVAKRED